ncbi:hypothetical protein CEP54_000497 [Fusarium duplospermum]|uniref:Uncharacterized protein n=1 Tax=Fusarium duplospermum TaxID=1325734 RepID=A0A428R736_9HYPO|nr:hypothetical protein CEP54_000497 [Fusarium duplospermum]
MTDYALEVAAAGLDDLRLGILSPENVAEPPDGNKKPFNCQQQPPEWNSDACIPRLCLVKGSKGRWGEASEQPNGNNTAITQLKLIPKSSMTQPLASNP